MKKLLFSMIVLLSAHCFSQSVTEVFYPQYVQGVGSGVISQDRKVPYACRMTVSGLTPGATYRYYSRFVFDPNDATNGTGNFIIVNQSGNFTRVTSASLGVAGSYGEFTTDGSGNYTGWFVAEPTSDPNFQSGTLLYWRIMLNNGAGGSTVVTRLTATNPVTVLGWVGGSTTLPGFAGTGIRSTATPAFNAKNFVLLFDNEAGTGRPVSGTFIESDGTVNNTSSGVNYAPFYATSVDNVDKAWGTIIPSNLSSGIRRICQYALTDGSSLGCATSPDGTFPAAAGGTLNTVNATGGLTALAINGSLITLPVTLVFFTASALPDNKVNLAWRTGSETNFSNFVVEVSKNATRFISTGVVTAKGDNSTYSFQTNLTAGSNYYRLKMVDIDGKFRYSNILAVNSDLSGIDLLLFPNPAQNSLTVSHSKAVKGASIVVTGMNGARMSTQLVQKDAVQTTVDLSRLSAGNYILIYYNEGKMQNVKFSKQ